MARFGLKKPSAQDPRPRGGEGVQLPAEEKVVVGVSPARIVPPHLLDSPEIVIGGAVHSPAAEKFRRLKTLLEHDEAGPARVVAVTSATPREGKSLVAVNLALTFAADRATTTLLVDADLRRPSVNRFFTPPPRVGLTEYLGGKAELEQTILSFQETTLEVLPAGQPSGDPVELLSAPNFQALVMSLRERYQRVIIDTPPIVPFTDADVVGRHADGILLVVRSGQTPKSLFMRAADSVSATRILGIVLNDVEYSLADRDRHYGRYYDHYYRDGKR